MPAREQGAAHCQGDPPGEVSVVMVSYRTGPVLARAIDAVLAPDQAGVGELILVDNGNPPDVTAALARRAEAEPRLRLVSGLGNVGYARACNLGAREARGRYLLLLNPDCCLGPGAVPALLAEAPRSIATGCSAAACAIPTAAISAARGGRSSPPSQRWSKRSGSTGFRRGFFGGTGSTSTICPFPRASHACLPSAAPACCCRPRPIAAAGGLDDGYFLHVEDLDLCLRLHRAGTPVYFAPHVQAIHHAGSSHADPLLVEWHKTRSLLRYFGLHYRALPWLALLGPLAAGCLARFGIRAMASWWRPARP